MDMSTSQAPGNSSASVASQEPPSGMPPMGMPPPQDGRSPRADHPPPPGAYHPGGPPPGPYSGGQPTPYQAAQQPYPPPQGNFAPQNFPSYGYSPMYGGGGAPPPFGAQPPQYYGGFPQGYPSQQPHQSKSEKSAPMSRRKSPSRRSTGSSSSKSPRSRPMNASSSLSKSRNAAELERQEGEVGSDLSNTVDPMRSAFHFFVHDMQEKLRKLAKEEVIKSLGGEQEDKEVDAYLVNTNLNSRLMKVWEEADESVREAYMEKEEEDRKRFMADDEIASRHCATLTARAKSPKFGSIGRRVSTTKREDDDEEQSLESGLSFGKEEDEKKRDSPENGESPTKKTKTEDGASE